MKLEHIALMIIAALFNFASAQDSISISLTDSIERYIITETKGGKLDFEKKLVDEKKQFLLLDSVLYDQKDASIYLWGMTVRKLGVSSVEKAVSLYQLIMNRSLTDFQISTLRRGFNRKVKK